MREAAVKGVFWRWGHWIYRCRWGVLLGWIAIFVAMAFYARMTPSLLTDNGFTPTNSESDRGIVLLQHHMGFSAAALDIAYESEEGEDLTTTAQISRILDSLTELGEQSYVRDVLISPYERLPGRNDVQSVTVTFHASASEALKLYPKIRSLIPQLEGLQSYATGGTPVYYDMQQASKRDLIKSELIGLPIALIVLLIVFGTLLAAALPLIVGLTSVTVSLGIVYFIAQVNGSLSNFLPNMITMLGLAVGIDYALFMVSRFRDQLKENADVGQAVAWTSQTAGKSIFFSGIAVLIGLVAMYFVNLSVFRSLSLGGALVVTLSVVAANSLLLSLLGLFGHRLNKFHVIPRHWRSKRSGEESRFWRRIAYGVMARPVPILLAISGLLICLMIPVGHMKIGVPESEVLPPSYESRYGADLLAQTYDVRGMNPIQIAVVTPDRYEKPSTIEAMESYMEQVKSLPNVAETTSYVSMLQGRTTEEKAGILAQPAVRSQLENQLLAKGKLAVVRVVPATKQDEPETAELVRALRKLETGELKTFVTGAPAFKLDIVERINRSLPPVLLFIFVVTFIILAIAFRSIVLPIKAVLMNVLSLGASLGIVVLVFQEGYLKDLFQVTSTGTVFMMLPVIIFCVVFGISMDYEVFLISRIVEEYETSGDNMRSTAHGLMKTGGIITSAAFILITVVGAFIFTDNEMMKAVGLGLATAVLLDATLIRIFLVPAFMKLMGKANWWAPKWMNPIRPRSK